MHVLKHWWEQSYQLFLQAHILQQIKPLFPEIILLKMPFYIGYDLSPWQTSKNLEIFYHSSRKLWAISFLNFSSKTSLNSSQLSFPRIKKTFRIAAPLLRADFFVDWPKWKQRVKTKDVWTVSLRGKPEPRINFQIFVAMKCNFLCERSIPNQMFLQTQEQVTQF